MGTRDVRCRVPLAAERHRSARQTSEPGPCGDCTRVLWVSGPWGQYSGKIHCIKKHWVQDEGGRHVAKRSSDSRQAYREVKLQRRDLVRVVSIVAPFVQLGAEPGENSLCRAPEEKWAQETCAGCF